MGKPKTFDTWPAEKQEEWREKVRERNRKYYEANPDKVREQKRKYYEANRDKERERKRKYQKANLDKAREYNRKHYRKNRADRDAANTLAMFDAAAELKNLNNNKTDQ